MDSTTLRSPLETLQRNQPICLDQQASISEVLRAMTDNNIGCVFITQNNSLVGIVTERDILTKVVACELDINATKVDEIMTRSPEYLYNEDEIAFAINRMHVGGFRHIPLLNLKGEPTGIVSVRDILGYVLRSLDRKN